MPGAFTSISIFAFDLDDRGQPIQVWETVVDGDEPGAVEEAKELAKDHAGTLVVKREGRPALGRSSRRIMRDPHREAGGASCGRRGRRPDRSLPDWPDRGLRLACEPAPLARGHVGDHRRNDIQAIWLGHEHGIAWEFFRPLARAALPKPPCRANRC